MTNEKDTFFSEENEAKSNWFKFKVIGDKVRGTFLEVNFKEADEDFGAQNVYTLLDSDGVAVNIGISIRKEKVINAMKRVVAGQEVGFLYKEDYQTEEKKKKGHKPSKTIICYIGAAPEVPVSMEGMTEAPTEEITLDKVPF